MNKNDVEVVRQSTITLPGLDEEAPALYLTDGRPYVPVFAVCRVLGIRAAPHIRRWKNLVFWTTARKLPFQTAGLSKRLVWCLLISEVPFLYSFFDWKLVSQSGDINCTKRLKSMWSCSTRPIKKCSDAIRPHVSSSFTS